MTLLGSWWLERNEDHKVSAENAQAYTEVVRAVPALAITVFQEPSRGSCKNPEHRGAFTSDEIVNTASQMDQSSSVLELSGTIKEIRGTAQPVAHTCHSHDVVLNIHSGVLKKYKSRILQQSNRQI